MMNMYEMDWQYSSTHRVLVALDGAMNDIEKNTPPHEDGIDMLDSSEGVVGVAFVALQQYITASNAAARRAFPGRQVGCAAMRVKHCQVVGDVPFVEGVWAAANYFKHHDEWEDWQPKGKSHVTISVLRQLGVNETTDFPCNRLVEALQEKWTPLVDLLSPLSKWREDWFSELRAPQ